MLYDTTCLDQLQDMLIRGKHTVSVAESVTSGHLQAAFSSAVNAMMFFQGGITAYNAGQKVRHLGVEPIYAMENDCISEDVAFQMAAGATRLFISDYGIGITGYATLPPDKNLPGLFAYAAIARGKEVLTVKKLNGKGGDMTAVQIDYANQVLRLFLEVVRENA